MMFTQFGSLPLTDSYFLLFLPQFIAIVEVALR